MQPLKNDDLNKLLAQWRVPRAPASLEARLQAAQETRWWEWMLRGRIQIPVPVAGLVLMALLLWGMLSFRPADGTDGTGMDAIDAGPAFSNFQLVTDVNPRIIRGEYGETQEN